VDGDAQCRDELSVAADPIGAGTEMGPNVFLSLEALGLAQLDRMETLMASSPQGFEGMIKSFAGDFGIPTEGLDAIQATTAIINKMIPEQRQPGSGPMSDRDIELFKASLPRILNQPGGNQMIMNTLRGIAQYEQQQGRIAGAVLNREMSPVDGRKALMELQNPLSFLNDVNAPPQAIEMLKGNPTPEAQAQFDEVFPKVAAARAMGGR
jgi:hypothetical protein